MKENVVKVWNWLVKIAGQYAKIIVFLGAFTTGSYWLIGPRVSVEVNDYANSLINPKLKARDSLLTINLTAQLNADMLFTFVEALKDTTFLNKITVVVFEAVDKKVDEKLITIIKTEIIATAEDVVNDTVFVYNGFTGEKLGYDIYHFWNGNLMKLKEVRY